MKVATRLKQTASALSSTTLSVGVVVTLGAAAPGMRTLATVISDGAAMSDTTAIQVGDTNVPFVFDDGTNWMEAYCTITSATQLTIGSIISGSNGASAVTFSGALPSVFSSPPGKWLRTVLSTADGVAPAASASAPSDTMLMLFIDPSNNLPYTVTVGTLKTLFASAPAATVTGVSVSPSTASLAGSASQTFTATVTGTNSPAQTVTWSCTGGGSITSGGVYTAPAATSSAQNITITATSTVDTSKSGNASVTVAATGSTVTGVSISPTSASLTGGGTQTFTATVSGTNSPSQSVTWAVTSGGGSITSGGVYTAPAATASAQNVIITATSVQDNTKYITASITIAAATVTSVAVSPSAPSVTGGTTQQFTATVTGTNNPPQTVTWSATAGSITSGGLFTAPASTSSAQTITVTATSTLDGTKSGTATVTVPATVATMASMYNLTATNGASLTGGNLTMTFSSPDYYAAPPNTRINIRSNDGQNTVPADSSFKWVWGKKGNPCPTTFSGGSPPAGSANGNQASHTNAVAINMTKLGSWTTGTPGSAYYGTYDASSFYIWGTPGTYILWVMYSDGSVKAYDNNTGTPIEYVCS